MSNETTTAAAAVALPSCRFRCDFVITLLNRFPSTHTACCVSATLSRVPAYPMNSLSYISRQFDVLASSAIPTTPPSTPTGEHSASFEDGSASRPPTMRRTRTWTSARSFFFPATVDNTKRPDHTSQHTFVPPQERPRRRSGSTSSGLRHYQQGLSISQALASSSSSSRLVAQPSEPNNSLAPAAEIVPPASRMPRNVTMQIESDRAHKTALRMLFILSNWFNTLWQSLLRSLRFSSYRRVRHGRGKETEADVNTSDEKESDDESSSVSIYSRSGPSYKQSRTSSLLNYVLQPHIKSSTPPLGSGRASILPTPTVNLIPPDSTDADAVSPASAVPEDLIPSSSSSSLRLPASPGGSASQATQSSSSNAAQQRTTPLHTRKTLVLDLDETLIHSTTRPLNNSTGNSGFFNFGSLIGNNKRAGHMVEVYLNGRVTLYHVYKRPFVDYFLKKVRCCLCQGLLAMNLPIASLRYQPGIR